MSCTYITCDNSGGEYYCSDDEDFTCTSNYNNYAADCNQSYVSPQSYPAPPSYSTPPPPSPNYPPPVFIPPTYVNVKYYPPDINMVYKSGVQGARYGYIKYPVKTKKKSTCYNKIPYRKKYSLAYLPPVCVTGCPCPPKKKCYDPNYPEKQIYSTTKCYKKNYCKPGYSNSNYATPHAPSHHKSNTYTSSSSCSSAHKCPYNVASYNNKPDCYIRYNKPPPPPLYTPPPPPPYLPPPPSYAPSYAPPIYDSSYNTYNNSYTTPYIAQYSGYQTYSGVKGGPNSTYPPTPAYNNPYQSYT